MNEIDQAKEEYVETDQARFSGWAVVEVMGHQSHIGYVTTQVFGAAVMFRVDSPAIPGGEEQLTRAEWVGEVYAQPGSVVKREDIPAASVLVGAGSIYRITPCEEAVALSTIQRSQRRPLIPVRLVTKAPQIAAVNDPDDAEEDDEDPY